jgi:hypothetical protein
MGKTKVTQRLKRKNDDISDDNLKNNWVVQKLDVTKEDFLELRSLLFRTDRQGNLLLKDNTFISFAAISYIWYDPSAEDNESPNNCVRLLRIFIQLQQRKSLEDVEAKLGITDLEEYNYDPLEDETYAGPIDARKALYTIIGTCQNMAYSGILRVKVQF